LFSGFVGQFSTAVFYAPTENKITKLTKNPPPSQKSANTALKLLVLDCQAYAILTFLQSWLHRLAGIVEFLFDHSILRN